MGKRRLPPKKSAQFAEGLKKKEERAPISPTTKKKKKDYAFRNPVQKKRVIRLQGESYTCWGKEKKREPREARMPTKKEPCSREGEKIAVTGGEGKKGGEGNCLLLYHGKTPI